MKRVCFLSLLFMFIMYNRHLVSREEQCQRNCSNLHVFIPMFKMTHPQSIAMIFPFWLISAPLFSDVCSWKVFTSLRFWSRNLSQFIVLEMYKYYHNNEVWRLLRTQIECTLLFQFLIMYYIASIIHRKSIVLAKMW